MAPGLPIKRICCHFEYSGFAKMGLPKELERSDCLIIVYNYKLQKLEFIQNLTELRLTSLRNGNANMTLDEINAEIAAARKEASPSICCSSALLPSAT
jgi:hypothetical protein